MRVHRGVLQLVGVRQRQQPREPFAGVTVAGCVVQKVRRERYTVLLGTIAGPVNGQAL